MKVKNRLATATAAALTFVSGTVLAQSTVNIGTSSGFFAPVTNFLQEIVDFMAGPFGLAAVVIIMIIAIVLWAAASRMEGTIGMLFRALIALIAIVNIATFVAAATG